MTMAIGASLAAGAVAVAVGPNPTTSVSPSTSASSTAQTSSVAEVEEAEVPTVAAALHVTELDLPDGVNVAVLDLTDGDTVEVGDEEFDTASIVKVDILAALLYQNDGVLTQSQQAAATAMITYSDNASATALFNAVGGAEGLAATNAEFGLTETTIGTNGNWGLTQTTVADQIRLLDVVFGEDSVLDEQSQAYLADLMGDVIDAQRFGVTAAADDPQESQLKVGYLQRTTTGLWDVTSIGRIEADGHTYLVAVLAEDQASFASGVEAIEDAVSAAVDAI